MKRWLVAFLALVAGAGMAQQLPQRSEPVRQPDAVYRFGLQTGHPTQLAAGPGRDTVAAYCSVCHTTTYITMQPPLPSAVWQSEVEKMIKVHGAAIPPDAEAKIIAYLQAHYTPQTIGHTGPAPVSDSGYMQTCLACHGDNGKGVASVFPPIAGRIAKIAAMPGGRAYVLHVALFGLRGPIEADGDRYNGAMPPWGKLLDDRALADILTFATHAWGASGNVPPFTPEEVATARKAVMTAAAVHEERARLHVR